MLVLILVQIGKAHLKHAPLQHLRGNLRASRAGDRRLPAVAHGKVARRLDVIPLLLGEGIDDLLPLTLLPLGQALVLADRLQWQRGGAEMNRWQRVRLSNAPCALPNTSCTGATFVQRARVPSVPPCAATSNFAGLSRGRSLRAPQ
eukprot:scaffold65868_cov32-Tisochrysis_lutea.AAC.1